MPRQDGFRGLTKAGYSRRLRRRAPPQEDLVMTKKPTRHIAALCILAAGLALGACSAQRDDFNPVRMMCPGDFDPSSNECVIQTGE